MRLDMPAKWLDWANVDDAEVEYVVAAIKTLDQRGAENPMLPHVEEQLWALVAFLINALNTNAIEWVPQCGYQLTTDWSEE